MGKVGQSYSLTGTAQTTSIIDAQGSRVTRRCCERKADRRRFACSWLTLVGSAVPENPDMARVKS